ncbi:hypothetical protein [Pilimelia terevasa]|uniref:hypothetical protein n=1 Tax=Pilimelia terevasa TaxID=53372 RepID=UPI00166F4025|nr:hypothetical protein [Pilimelia terevasa]
MEYTDAAGVQGGGLDAGGDADRVVDLVDDDLPLLPEQTGDDTDRGWGDFHRGDDAWLLAERPPHWD